MQAPLPALHMQVPVRYMKELHTDCRQMVRMILKLYYNLKLGQRILSHADDIILNINSETNNKLLYLTVQFR